MRLPAALGVLALALAAAPAQAISPEAREYLEVAKELEAVHCRKRKLTREIVLADAERDAARSKALRAEIEELGRDPKTGALEKRMLRLQSRIVDGEGRARRPEDLDAINLQRREAFYRCG